jgi:UDP-N-acetylglucosamine--N-acetylmuramyl-(pentapeptide) pyrophosphoryl-undecaprenol N-acetylglucosamine transferase
MNFTPVGQASAPLRQQRYSHSEFGRVGTTGAQATEENGKLVSRRVYFAVFGSGLGHVTRILEISESLRQQGDEFRFSCADQALDYLTNHGHEEEVLKSPSLDVEWTEDGSFSSKDFIPKFPFMFSAFLRQIAFERENIARFDPRVVVTDSRLSPILAARAKSYPVVTMLNQFKVSFPPRFSGKGIGRLYERFAGDVLGLLWSLSDEVLMTDLPPPYTIGEANLAGTDVSKIVRYVGFTSPDAPPDEEGLARAKSTLDIDSRPLAFFQISGPDVTKRRFVDTVLQSTDELSRRYNVVISMGFPGGSGEPQRLANGAWIYDWCPIKDELFALSSVVVARAGHRTIGQCIDAGKPAVLVPIHNHSEQIGNANKFSKLGLGIEVRSEKLTVKSLTESVEACLSDPSYSESVQKLSEISKRYNGIQRCAQIIRSYD